jgi:hypothetical protein
VNHYLGKSAIDSVLESESQETKDLGPLKWNTYRNICPNLHKVSVRFCWGSHLSVVRGTMGQSFVRYGRLENPGQQAANKTAKQTTLSVWLFCQWDSKSAYYSVKGNSDCGPAFRVWKLNQFFLPTLPSLYGAETVALWNVVLFVCPKI